MGGTLVIAGMALALRAEGGPPSPMPLEEPVSVG